MATNQTHSNKNVNDEIITKKSSNDMRETSRENNIRTNNDNRNNDNAQKLKKDGSPDHRYAGQREGADEDNVGNEDYTRAQTGPVTDEGIHLKTDGVTPDMRFKENRGLDEEEAKRIAAENILKDKS